MTAWIQSHPVTFAGLIIWVLGILWLLPARQVARPRPRIPGLLLSTVGIIMLCSSVGTAQSKLASEILFWLFSVSALLCGVLMVTSRNPVYGALWFALVTLSTCGLFLLQSAPFLAASTIIVYAGAVIVTFLFVIMLAQQGGALGYDQQSRQGIPATVAAFILLGAIVMTLQMKPVTENKVAAATSVTAGNPLSIEDTAHPLGSMKGLGRSLFGDYLFAVELAGTLLLIASIGAIAIAPRREQGAI